MTIDVSNNNPRIEYSVSQGSSQSVFTVPFEFFDNSDVKVYVDDVLKSEGADYSLAGGDGSTGTLTFSSPVVGATGGSIVVLARHTSLERTTDFVAGQDINRAALNEQLDTIVAQIADLDDKVDRTIHLSDSEVAPSMLLTDDRKGRVLAFNSSTGAVEAGPLSNDIATIADNIAEILAADDEAAAAAASATAAATSASAAAASAVDATNNGAAQVALAADQVTLAETAKTAAQTAQTAAELAEANAETAETNAETAETNAAASAAAALASETSAASSASSASTSASNAASSASSASASADAALAALDNFDDRYLGQKASDPATDNDGDALVAGALYFNTTDEIMKVYDGSLWVAAYASLSGAMFGANNLSDVASASDSRNNLGLGSSDTPTFAGVDVTGTLTSDGLTVDGDAAILDSTGNTDFDVGGGTGQSTVRVYSPSKANSFSVLNNGTAFLTMSDGEIQYRSKGTSGQHSFKTTDSNTNRMIVANNGDISFYEDTGTTPKFFWDASAESLGIGTSSITSGNDLQIYKTDVPRIALTTSSSTGSFWIDKLGVDSRILNTEPSGSLRLYTASTERMRLDSSGNVGIGSTNPAGWRMRLEKDDAQHLLLFNSAGNGTRINLADQSWQGEIEQNAGNLLFKTGGTTERMRIDSSGNVGIGTSSPDSMLHVKSPAFTDSTIHIDATSSNVSQRIDFRAAGTLTSRIYDDAVKFEMNAVANKYMTFRTNNTERMRIDSSGNVGIGTSSPSSYYANHLVVDTGSSAQSGITIVSDTGNQGMLAFADGTSGDTRYRGAIDYNHSNDSMAFLSSGNEAMRIDSSGNLLVGKTVANTTTEGVWLDGPNGRLFATADDDYTAQFTRNGSDGVLVYWYNDTAQAGSITISGSSCAYNTSSDYRLKTDAQPMTGASARVQALKPVNFEWIASGDRVDGFLAHEAQEVVPEAVTGTKDAMRDEEYEVTPAVLDDDGNVVTEAVMGTRSVPDYQGIDQSKLVPLLTAALQEALTEIADLKVRITALEG